MGARGWARLAAALALGATAGCFTVGERESRLQEQVGATEMTPDELRQRVRDLAAPFSGELEHLADELAATTTSAEVKAAALRIKIDGIPQMQRALFRPDAAAGLLDAWAFMVQLEHAFERLGGASPAAALAAERLAGMEAQLEALWRQVTGRTDISRARELVRAWAAENPLETMATRPSTVGLFAEVTAGQDLGAFQAAGELLDLGQDLALRVDLQSWYVPKQARWQAEYLALGLLSDPALAGAVGDPEALVASLERSLRAIGTMPSWVEGEREAILAALRAERLDVQAFASGERRAVMEGLAAERRLVLEALSEERAAILAGGDELARGWIDEAFDRSIGLVDRILLRVLLLLLVGAALGALLVLLLTRRGRRLETRRRVEV